MSRIVVCLSIFIILAVCVERFLAVCRPHHYREGQTRSSRFLSYLLPAILAAILVNLTKFFEVRLSQICVDYSHCGCGQFELYILDIWWDFIVTYLMYRFNYDLTDLRKNKQYIIYFHSWTWITVTGCTHSMSVCLNVDNVQNGQKMVSIIKSTWFSWCFTNGFALLPCHTWVLNGIRQFDNICIKLELTFSDIMRWYKVE